MLMTDHHTNHHHRTVEEAYTRAGTSSSNLKVDPDRRGDADVLIAAGWSPGMLGGALMRLRGEWDSAALPRHGDLGADAPQLLGRLRSLGQVLSAVERWAAAKGLADARTLARSCVCYWLDPTCHACLGRGSSLVPGTPLLGRVCKACGGTRKAVEPMGQDGRRLLNLIDDCVARRHQSMKKRLHATKDRG
ncbi:hypothetical protein [Acidovorax sp. Root219]|uniref:hypothetical protein n=1 Tax=Acidovorax sp. Root219 TaxID=1736493 RepID=UPI00070D0EB5|nr:hypothetical protein [Acidovorax sp. Root219]KRC18080.1 hypothetical protein ASE28_04680 [Acidovorax sp. Root219]